jgi:UDP-N-acetylglucosamine 2-epimerase (non-hydrolysing)
VSVAVRQQANILDQTYASLRWTPDVWLDRTTTGFALADMLSGVVAAAARLIDEHKPAAVVVQGDTTTAFASALAGFYARVPVVHVEAGLRTWTMEQPFPEEMHRACIDQFAALCLAPTSVSRDNLKAMGIGDDRIVVTGNTVVDALLHVRAHLPPERSFPVPAGMRRVVVTCHRRENFEGGVREVCAAVLQLVQQHADLDVVVTKHPNPNVARVVEEMLTGVARVQVVDPVPYRDFVHLMSDAFLILTDSGGIQEEATAIGKPFFILREGTERPEALGAGLLVGASKRAIVDAFTRLQTDKELEKRMTTPLTVFGDGTAAVQSVRALERVLSS